MANDTNRDSASTAGELTAGDLHQALLNIELAMRMLGKAVSRFAQLRAIHGELRFDPEWTNFEVQMHQALTNVREAICK
ncbi:MAG: hypothetical protein KF841_09580 [Phycisphaerae bacterium]|nr:hypothetical protein [Phycisphaerae bacterium]